MNIVFMGTPAFAVPCLEALLQAGYTVSGVVSQPDRPKGRKRELTPPPVKAAAEAHGLPVYQPESLKVEGAFEPIQAWQPDLIVTAAYGQLLPVELLDLPKFRCINVHASLLPKYRGGAPIQHAIMNGEPFSGVTIMYMERGLDTGDMLAQTQVEITANDDNGTMHEKLSAAGAQLLIEMLPAFLRGEIVPEPQDQSLATFAKNIQRADERIDWSHSTVRICNHVRGLHPWPIAFTMCEGELYKILKAEAVCEISPQECNVAAGTIIRCDAAGIVVRSGDGAVLITVIQPAGKRAMPVSDYIRGKHLLPGAIFA
jgi:methionyl-tRNA formyltransferase